MVSGHIPACKWVKLACRRHLNDIKASQKASFPWVYDETRARANRANRACRLIENLPHTKGEWAAGHETIKLGPWQIFIVCSLFGWVEKKDPKRYRFREAYVKVPRKNGKSVLAAGVGLVKFAADGEYGAEVYSGATTEKQAWEIFRPAKQMCERTDMLRSAFGIGVNAKSLVITKNGSRFEPVIGKPGDGASPSCALIDEYHEHPTDDLVSTMRTGMAARRNPLLFEVTTAGTDRSSPCYNKEIEAQELLTGQRSNEHMFAIMYGIDADDDWTDEAALKKANPNFNVSVGAEWLREEQKQAIQSARLQNAFKTKHLNIWENADTSWMNMVSWEKSADPNLNIDSFAGEECFVGLDLASKVDIVCKANLFRRVVDGKTHYYAFLKHYINQAAVDDARNNHYSGWAIEGKLVITPGNMTDHVTVMNDLVQDSKKFRIREVAHDPYGATPLMNFLQANSDWNQTIELVAIDQTTANMSPAMKDHEAVVLDGRFHFDGDPILTWMVSNVVCHRDAKDNIYPRKQRDENKIDGEIAILNGWGRMLNVPMGDFGNIYERRGLLSI